MTIRKLIRDFNIKDYIFFNSFNPFYDDILPADHPPKYRIYQSIDDMKESEYVCRHGARIEREVINRTHFSFATSRKLCRILSSDQVTVRYLPNAADINIFKKALYPIERPSELKHLENKKIIGYTGNIGPRQDYELLKKIAENFPEQILLLVGPRSDKRYTRINLDAYPNVIFTGSKDINDLPAYLRYIDCAIIPFKCNELTSSIYPLKVNEYLAAGKPVVATSFSEEIEDFKEVIFLAHNHDQFLNHIQSILEKKDDLDFRKRVVFAEKNTWTSRVNSFWTTIHPPLVNGANANGVVMKENTNI